MISMVYTPTIVASTQQRFKKFGKDMSEKRKSHIGDINKKMREIAEEEKARAKKIFEEHKSFFTNKESETSVKSIDFYEK